MAAGDHSTGAGRTGPIVAVALGILVVAGLAALLVSRNAAPAPETTQAPAGPADHTYTLRGRIVSLPGPEGEMQIHHEAIPDFKNAQGDVVGMREMTMPFPLAQGLDLPDLHPGDQVEFTFEVRWTDGIASWQITAIQPAPPSDP